MHRHTTAFIHPEEDGPFERKNNFIPFPDKMLRQGPHKFSKNPEATPKF
jgi:hypothetical protein